MTKSRKQRLVQVAAHRQFDLTVVLENVWDPHNMAAVLRSCDAVGVQEIQLVYTTEKFPGIGTKAAAGVKKWLTLTRHSSIAACYRNLRRRHFNIYASALAQDAVSLYRMNLRRPTALVFGNEHRGVSEEAQVKANGVFRIPMVGFTQSLNISVACAVALYEALRQRRNRRSLPSPRAAARLCRHWQTIA